MNAPHEPIARSVTLTLDGETIEAREGELLIEVAARHGVEIPHLCWKPGYRSAGNCRACVVEIAGERVLAPSCCRTARAGLAVETASARARKAQALVLELLRADVAAADSARRHDSELDRWCDDRDVRASRFAPRASLPEDRSHPAIAVNLDACIQCTRCVRACREEQVNDVIGMALRGAASRIVFDQGDELGASTCVGCGECVQACPTGALAPSNGAYAIAADREIPSVCPYCGVGCRVTYRVKDERIVSVEGRDEPSSRADTSPNRARLCIKGRFGFDYAHHPDRLATPLVRRDDAPKDPTRVRIDDWRTVFREATWDEALARAADGFARVRTAQGPQALAGFGSAKGTNEEAYLFQKLVRAGFGSNNVDHCTRLCHASSVAALLEGVGSGAVSNPVRDVEQAEVVLLIGANPAINHPVAATWMKNAMKRGTRFVIADPRRGELARHAWRTLPFRADTDVAMLNAMLHTILEEDLVDAAFVRARTRDVEALRETVRDYAPERVQALVGIDAATLREVARAFATARTAMILWGMGVSQHVHGTDNARCLIALAMITGQIGRPGTGLHPLRGQNNVQGASDAGLIPMVFPDYRRVDDAHARAHAEAVWALPPGTLDPRPGLTVVEIIHAAARGDVRGMLVMGENPAMSDPDVTHAREALATLDHLVVQDIFLTETAALADVVLPATAWPEKTGTVTNTDRCVQLGRKAVASPGDARADLWVLEQLGRRLGLAWHYDVAQDGSPAGVGTVYEEMRALMPSIAGISWARLQREGAVTYPCEDENAPGHRVVFETRFPTEDGRARLVPARFSPGAEQPDEAYPLVLITGRQLEHWHTGTMTRRAASLDATEPGPTASLHPALLASLGVRAGESVEVRSRRGAIRLTARVDAGVPHDAVFVPFAYVEAAANVLTNPALDPFGKIAEVKYCAVRVSRIEATPVD